MIFGKLTINNIGPFEKAEYNFAERQRTLIMGINHMPGMSRNAAGKSMIPEILTWVLWEQTVRGISKDDMLRIDTDTGWASIEIFIGDYKYLITRYRGKINSLNLEKFYHSSSKEICTKDEEFKGTGQKVNVTQNNINKILGMDFDTFVNSAYLGQRSVFHFLEGSSSDRIKIITKFFGLYIWDYASDKAKSELKKVEIKKRDDENQIAVWDEVLNNIDDEKIQKEKTKLHSIQSKLKVKIDVLKNKIQEIRNYLLAVEDINGIQLEIDETQSKVRSQLSIIQQQYDQLKEKRNKLPSIKEKIKTRENAESKLEELEQQLQVVNDKLASCNKNKITFDLSRKTCLKNVTDSEKLLDANFCPTCKQKIGDHHRAEILKSIKKNKAHALDWANKLKNIGIEIKQFEEVKKALEIRIDGYEAKITQLAVLKRDLKYCEEAKERMEEIKSKGIQIKETGTEKIKVLSKRKSMMEKQLGVAPKSIEDGNIDEIERQVFRLMSKSEKISQQTGIYKNQLSQYRSASRKKEELEEQRDKSKQEIIIYTYLIHAFAVIKLVLIDEVNINLEDSINDKLKDMGIDITLKLITERNKKDQSGKIDKYEIVVQQEGQSPRVWKSYSGGEKQRLVLAVYLAFQLVEEQKLLEPINLAILDEIFSGMDDIGKSMVLGEINKINKNVHIITHLEDMIEEFDQDERVIVEKNEEGISSIQRPSQ